MIVLAAVVVMVLLAVVLGACLYLALCVDPREWVRDESEP